jgi:hypothetical protein
MPFRLGLVCARSTLFDPQMPSDFPALMRKVADDYLQFLQQRFDVIYPGLIETSSDAERVHCALTDERLDLLVVAPTMAVPPGLVLPAISAAETPVLPWNALTRSDLGSGPTQTQATEHTTTVGCLMIGNALQRLGRRTTVVTTLADDEASCQGLERTPMGDSWVLDWATGEVVDLRVPNGMFRFDSGDVIDATTCWIASGATHHNALGLGRLDLEMPAIADALRIRSVRV